MDAHLLRKLEHMMDGDEAVADGTTAPGRSTLTSRITPAPQVIFRVSDPETARALGESLSSGSRGRIQRDADGAGAHGARDNNGVAEGAEAAVERAGSSSGQPLRGDLRERFEGSLGADLSSVRVHTGAESAEANHAVGARAYTVGSDIHFNEGQYRPDDPFGMHLLAHEVAHTVQQSGGTAGRQHKLEVSTPGDALEHEADRAADAMVAGQAFSLAGGVALASRKVHRDVDTGTLQGAGDEAQAAALKAKLSVDNISVKADASRSDEMIAEIDKHTPIIKEASKEHPDLEAQYAPLATNTATKAKLSIFNDKVDTGAVDTAAFGVQYRQSHSDYMRLKAEASEVLTHLGGDSADPIGDVGDAFGNTNLKVGTAQAGLAEFKAARNNLHTAGKKMDAQMTKVRGAAGLLQGAIYKAKAAAAAAKGKEAAANLAAVRAEIDAVAGGVGKVVKIASAVAGLAGGGGATNALATPKESGGHVDVDPSRSGLGKGGTVLTEAEGTSKAELMKAMGSDLAGVFGVGGDPSAMAEQLVKAIGEYANKDKIAKLQASITEAAAQEKTFNAGGDASSFVGYQEQMDGASKDLANLLTAFGDAKRQMSEASQALMEELNKGGKKGKDQAKGVMFLGDADRFLAQVNNAIAVGENQQKNLEQAASDRKSLRGTTNTIENEPDRQTQVYFKCHKTTTPGKLWGTNDHFRLEKVDVTFQSAGGGYNDIVQGGSGTVEGTGGAADAVKQKIDVLKQAKEQVTKFQGQVQGALGVGAPVMNA